MNQDFVVECERLAEKQNAVNLVPVRPALLRVLDIIKVRKVICRAREQPSQLRLAAPLWTLAFAVLGAALLGSLGLIAAVVSDKIDQVAAFQNFAIVPLTFLSGVFYSIHTLPPFWQGLSHANPFFYMVDGFRYGFFGVSDFPPAASLAIVFASVLAVSSATLWLLKSGYKLRH